MSAEARQAFEWIASGSFPAGPDAEILYTGAAGILLIPPKPDRPTVNFGWRHGPTGTLRLFGLLEQCDPHPRWTDGAAACVGALRAGRLPARLYPGYGDRVVPRC